MGQCVELITHDKCGSGRLQVFQAEDGSYNGYCFGCGTPVSNPYKDKPEGYRPDVKMKTQEEVKQELEELVHLPCVDLPSRSLKVAALSHYGVTVGFDEATGQEMESYHFPYYDENGELVAVKSALFALNEKGKKQMWSSGAIKKAMPFGWKQAIDSGSPRLYVTEGEFDAVALYSIIRKGQLKNPEYKDRVPAVISLKSGATSANRDLSALMNQIRRHFKEVVLVFDMDDPGRAAAEEVVKNHPDIMVAELPQKDANECLAKGNVQAAFRAVMFQAQRPKNTRLVWGDDLVEAGRKEAVMGRSTPFEGLTKLIRGFHDGNVYYWGAGVKMGKSELVNTLLAHDIKAHGRVVFAAKPEEANVKTFQMLAGKVAGRMFHDPEVPFDYEAYDRASEVLKGHVCLVNLYQHLGWESLRADIRLAAAAGAKTVVIDPVTNLTAGMNAADVNTKLNEIAVELATIALDLDITVHVFCHLKAPEAGPPHERGGAVMSTQFAGSRAMMRSCQYMIGIEGNKDPDLPEFDRNKRTIVVLEDRIFGMTGKVNVHWDRNTTLFSEV